jgi:hypothetical protein
MGHTIGRTLVGELLHKLDDRLQANRKTREGSHNPDRDAQFHYINARVKEALAAGNISRRSGNAGWVSVGIDHDTAAFAANAIRSWWTLMRRERYPNARSLKECDDARIWVAERELNRRTPWPESAKELPATVLVEALTRARK